MAHRPKVHHHVDKPTLAEMGIEFQAKGDRLLSFGTPVLARIGSQVHALGTELRQIAEGAGNPLDDRTDLSLGARRFSRDQDMAIFVTGGKYDRLNKLAETWRCPVSKVTTRWVQIKDREDLEAPSNG